MDAGDRISQPWQAPLAFLARRVPLENNYTV